MGKKKGMVNLGRSLLKDKRYQKHDGESYRHTSELNDGSDWAKLNLRSVTEQTNIDDFLSTAELAGTQFTAEKENVKIISTEDASHLLSDKEKKDIEIAQAKYKSNIRIPRRPEWNENTTAELLGEMEREAFLNWRRSLAELQEKEHILMTPYEKNLEFWRQLWRVVERSDIVVQILDARNPLLFRCEDLEQYVNEINQDKINVLLLNKADLLTQQQREWWTDYFNDQNMIIAFYSALEENKNECDDEDEEEMTSPRQSESSYCDLSTEEINLKGKLLSQNELAHFWRSLDVKKTHVEKVLTVGLVGYPNVGKSSTINSLLQSKKVSVSATPGKTKHFQTLMLSEDLCLCDCPGLVFPSFVSTKAEMIINGILPIDQMTFCIPPMALLTSVIPKRIFEDTYGIALSNKDENEIEHDKCTTEELLNSYGYARGFMTQRGLPDVSRAARYILKDFVNGKVLYCSAPPNMEQNNYHTFPERRKDVPRLTPAQSKLLDQDKNIGKNIEDAFFKKVNLQAHKKLKGGNQENAESNAAKPWKKHHNKNKREKLRRVYSELDQ